MIFCAAEYDGRPVQVEPEDLLIAADGGVRHLEKLGIAPDVKLGDFDSLGYVPRDGVVFPVGKDDTDAMLAVRLGLERGYREFVIYGGLDGPRLDHTVANFQTLQYLADRSARGFLVGKDSIVTVIKNGTLEFAAADEGLMSVFCMGADAEGVCIEGLQYALEDGMLTAGFPLGVSNHFVGKPAAVRVARGSLLLIWDRKIGMPV